MSAPEHFAAIAYRHLPRPKEMTMSEPATPEADPVPASCCDTVRDLIVRGVRVGEIHRDSAVPILAVLGFEPGDVEELVHAAEEAGQ